MSSYFKAPRLITILICILTTAILLFTGCGGGTDGTETADTGKEDTTVSQPAETPEPEEKDSPAPQAGFSFSELKITKKEVQVGENVGISVKVTNNGNESGSWTVEMRVNGKVAAFKDVNLAGGASETLSFKNSQNSPGTYTVEIGKLSGEFTVTGTPSQPGDTSDGDTPQEPEPAPPQNDWVIPEGSGTLLRAVHMGGNWGDNTNNVDNPPEEYFEYLRDLNVNWVGISTALHVSGSTDSTVEFVYDGVPQSSWEDDTFRNLVRAFRNHDFNVYIHVAFENTLSGDAGFNRYQMGDPFMHAEDPNISAENWLWRTDHPEHEEFVAEFWRTYTECLVHIAEIAEEEGVGMLTLGTETDRLFRSRTGGRWPNNYLTEMQAMVSAVREVYSGQLSYEMLHFTLQDRELFGPCSDYLYEDLDLDFLSLSAYFKLANTDPRRVMGVEELEAAWEVIFAEDIIPWQQRNPGKPVIFTEFGYTDVTEAPYEPSARQFVDKMMEDRNGNGLDDGEEAQNNCIEAFYNVMERHQGVVTGAFLWDVMMSTQIQWDNGFGKKRTFSIRDNLAEDMVRQRYADWFDD